MEKGYSLIRIMVLAAFSAGLVIYLLGLVVGFLQAFTVYMFYSFTSNSYTLIPVFQFEVYPTFVSIISPLPLSFERLSPLTLMFLAFAVLSVVSTYLKKFRIALLSSILTFIPAVMQFTVLTTLVGSEPTGLSVMFLLASPIFNPITLLMVFSSKNLVLIILPAFIFGTGIIALFAIFMKEKVVLVAATPVRGENFNALRSILTQRAIVFIPFLVLGYLGFLPGSMLLLTEFPHYPLLAYSSSISNSNFFFEFFMVYSVMYYLTYFLTIGIYNRAINRLVEACIPLLAKKLDKQKPVISLWEVKEKLGLKSANKRFFKTVLKSAAPKGDKEGSVYFGLAGDYLYLKDQLSLIVRERIKNQGKADIYEIASEIQVDPKLLRTIYYRLRREMLFEDLMISRNIVTPLRSEEYP
ncbi:MAG: hypothetical protein WED07_02405 [Candidatus Freyarchaeum deiterrae]